MVFDETGRTESEEDDSYCIWRRFTAEISSPSIALARSVHGVSRSARVLAAHVDLDAMASQRSAVARVVGSAMALDGSAASRGDASVTDG